MKKYHTYSFEKLEVYQNSLQLSVKIRKIAAKFPAHERYELTSQLKRAVDSIGANIGEGAGRASNLDQAHFTNVSFSSGLEVIHHLNLAQLLEYMELETYESLRENLDLILNQLNALYKYQVKSDQSLKKKTRNG